jgi:hypothetical protein
LFSFYEKKKNSSIAVDLDSWITGSCSNTALIAFVTAHFNVTLVTPASSPAVFDEPVIFVGVGTITYSEDTVIKTSL